MRILITGAGGFLGGILAERLALWPGAAVTGWEGRLGPGGVDLNDRPVLEPRLAALAPDVVVHVAGRTRGAPSALLADNALATANLVEALAAATPATGLILMGSAAQYGPSETKTPWRETDPCQPQDPYGVAKLAAERCAFAEAHRLGLKITSLRLFNLVSSTPAGGQVFAVEFIAKAAKAASAGPPPWRVSMGNLGAVRDFVGADEVPRAVRAVIGRGVWGEAINLCTGVGRPVRELIAATADELPERIEVEESNGGASSLDWAVGDPGRCEALLEFRPSSDLTAVVRRAAALIVAAREAADAGS